MIKVQWPDEYYERQKMRAALTYPIIMLCVGTTIFTFLLAYVVPEVATIFVQQHAALPASTKLVIRTSGFFTSHWLAFALLLLATVAGVGGTLATPPGNRLYHYYLDEVVRPHIDEMTTVLEPVMTLAMAAVIVFMMLAVLMPIFQLNQLMQ
jgi:type II secretory pathway component PulF